MMCIVVSLIVALLVATFAILSLARLPGDPYSELYLLNRYQSAENYPFNILAGQPYEVYVGVKNNMGTSAYFVLEVKFKNETDPMPDSTTGLPSLLQPLCEYRFMLQDGCSWETPIDFSVLNSSVSGPNFVVNTLEINGLAFELNKPALWDSNTTTFSYQLLFELWTCNTQTGLLSYDNRFVSLQLNMTQTA